jgi:nitrilase
MRVAAAQIAPVFLDRERTLAKVVAAIDEAAAAGCALIAFGEAFVPGYPAWISRLDGARFDAPDSKELHALYLDQAVDPTAGHLATVAEAARRGAIAVVLGIVERAPDRGGHSLYCSLVYVDASGQLAPPHRKLMPTYEERLAWGVGDAHGLVVHRLGDFTVGALNCWESWVPLARAALHAQGEDLHVAIWPGSQGLTRDLTRFVALEGRSYVLSAGALLRAADLPASVPHRARMIRDEDELIYDGGSCIAAPDGSWLVPPVVGEERLVIAELDPAMVRRERQNLDISGHYARPDLLRLAIDRRRHPAASFRDAD